MVPCGFSGSQPPTDRGEVRTKSSKWHNCPIIALLASLFGQSTANEVQPYEVNWRITWLFRLWLADQIPETENLVTNSVEDWRRTLVMMYEGALFRQV